MSITNRMYFLETEMGQDMAKKMVQGFERKENVCSERRRRRKNTACFFYSRFQSQGFLNYDKLGLFNKQINLSR